MTDPEQKSTTQNLFMWWRKKKNTAGPDKSSQTQHEADQLGQSKRSPAKHSARKKAPVVLISVTRVEEETSHTEDVNSSQKLNCKPKEYRRHESEDKKEVFDKTLSSFKIRNESGFPSRAISLQHLPRKLPEEESKEEKKTSISKVWGRLATSLGSLSRIGKGKKAKHSADHDTISKESTHNSKDNERLVRFPIRHSYHLDTHELTQDFYEISSPLAFSSPNNVRIFGKTNIFPPHVDIPTSRSNQKYFGNTPLSKTAPSTFHPGSVVNRGEEVMKRSLSTSQSPMQQSHTKVDDEKKPPPTIKSNLDGATNGVSLEALGLSQSATDDACNVIKIKGCNCIVTLNHDNSFSYNTANDSDDDVFLPCTNSTLASHRHQPIPSVRVALRDETSSVNISETNLNFLSDSSSSLGSSVHSCEATNHHLTIETFYQRHFSITSDITDVTSMTSSSSLTPRCLYQDDESAPDDGVPSNYSSDGDDSRQEYVAFPWCRCKTKQKEYSNNQQTNEQLLSHRAVFKQPSFGELERDFEDFVNKYNAKQITKENKETVSNRSHDSGFS